MKDAEKIQGENDLVENQTGKKPGKKVIDFTQTNEAGAVDTLNDADRIQNAGTNIEIVGGTPELLQQPLPEAGFTTRIVDVSGAAPIPSTNEPSQQSKPKNERVANKTQEQQPYATLQSAPGSQMPPPPPPPGGNHSFNPDFDDDIKEKKSADEEPGDDALATADFAHRSVDSLIVRQIPGFFRYTDSKIDNLHEKKSINKFAVFQLPQGGVKTVPDVFNEFNNSIDEDKFIIPEQWIKENNPLLAKILKKKGAVLTDEARYGLNCVALAISIGGAAFQVKKAADNLIKQLKASTIQQPTPAAAPVPDAGLSTPDINNHTADNTIVDPEKLAKEKDEIAESVKRALKNAGKKKTGEGPKKTRSKKESIKVLTEESK